ncbi:hypothetical protein F2Q69_00028631 [Brassica cretica]|uniref:Uncharacterized protein n=1 Tax=Brassica cretica TaxID=69181 RepID=A0A8S9S3U6_BRACR|nr:hypothetical protein F2Q69_00028631 [Brassica cretica]
MPASPCLLQPPCVALPPPHNSHCDHGWSCLLHHQASSASSTIKLFLHPPPSFTKNKQKSDSKRETKTATERYMSNRGVVVNGERDIK